MIHVTGAIDAHTRCRHYHSEVDVIAIKLKCCNTYYGCYYCHAEAVDHQPIVWPMEEQDTKAILCGNCHSELTVKQYLNSQYKCPVCNISFNPGCKNHNHLYFEQRELPENQSHEG